MKLLKALVAFMTLLIFIGTGLLVYGLLFHEKDADKVETLDTLSLAQPVGSHIAGLTFEDGLLFVTVEGGGLGERILVVSPEDGGLKATISLSDKIAQE